MCLLLPRVLLCLLMVLVAQLYIMNFLCHTRSRFLLVLVLVLVLVMLVLLPWSILLLFSRRLTHIKATVLIRTSDDCAIAPRCELHTHTDVQTRR